MNRGFNYYYHKGELDSGWLMGTYEWRLFLIKPLKRVVFALNVSDQNLNLN